MAQPMMAYALGSSDSFMSAIVYQISLLAVLECGVALVGMAEEVWRMLPPAQRRHMSFSETRMNGAKQLSFCGAVARATLIGVGETWTGQCCPKVNARGGRREYCPPVDISQSLQGVNTRESCVYFWRRRRRKFVKLPPCQFGTFFGIIRKSSQGEGRDTGRYIPSRRGR